MAKKKGSGAIRIMDRALHDETGRRWDYIGALSSKGDFGPASMTAERTIVHYQSSREARDPFDGEVENLLMRFSTSYEPGNVIVSIFGSDGRRLLLLTEWD